MDLYVPSKTIEELYALAESVPEFKNGGIGAGSGKFHVDMGPMRRWSYNKQGKEVPFERRWLK